MNMLNKLFTLYSITAFVIIIERLLPATMILLPPYDFIRLHEINQTVIFLSISVIISFLLLKIITHDFQALKEKNNAFLALLFVVGIYLFGAGEGWHEVASFTFHTYCDENNLSNNLCGGLFINDYYAGNIIFFIGGILMNTALMALAAKLPIKSFSKKDLIILFSNSVIYAFTWFAYATFDTVLVGLFFSALLMFISLGFFIRIRKNWKTYPYITYSATAYTMATIATIFVRFH